MSLCEWQVSRNWKFDPKDWITAFPGEKKALVWGQIYCGAVMMDPAHNRRRLVPDHTTSAEVHVVGRRFTPHWNWFKGHAADWWIVSTDIIHWVDASPVSSLCTKREPIKQNTDASTLNWWHHLAGVTSPILTHILLTEMNSCVDHMFGFSGQSAQSPRLNVIESKTSQPWKLQQSPSHMEGISRGEEHTKGTVNRVSTFPLLGLLC